MANRVCTRFIDNDGLDIGCHLVSKEYVLEAYPELVPWMKTPALWGWGKGLDGNLGNNSIIARSSPVQTASNGTNWKQVSAYRFQIGAVKTDGTLWMWGAGGLVGDNYVISRSSPVQTISGGTNWKSVSVGYENSAAIKTDGTLWLWGAGRFGAHGNNSTINRSSPVQTVSAGTNWKQVSVGYGQAAAIKTDGTLWSWGTGYGGSLGNNSQVERSSPVQTVSGGTNWKQVSTSGATTGAIKTDGTLWLWGRGNNGQLGNNTTYSSRSSPVQTVSGGTNWKEVSIGNTSAGAIKTDGTLWMWGSGGYGRLGTGNDIQVSSPVQTVSGGANWFKLAVGKSSAAIKTDGSLWVWGNNYCGQLGTNNTFPRSSPVQTVSGGTGWKSVSVPGSEFNDSVTFAIRDEGEF